MICFSLNKIYRDNILVLMTKLYGYDGNDDGIMLNKRIY